MAFKIFGTKPNVYCANIMAHQKNFFLFLKECEFRFNHGSPAEQIKILQCGQNSNFIYDSPKKINAIFESYPAIY